MSRDTSSVISLVGVALALLLNACGPSTNASSREAAVAPVAPELSEAQVNAQTLRFLEDKVRKDPEDFIAQNKLAAYYLQQVRETSDVTYLKLAARASLLTPAKSFCRASSL